MSSALTVTQFNSYQDKMVASDANDNGVLDEGDTVLTAKNYKGYAKGTSIEFGDAIFLDMKAEIETYHKRLMEIEKFSAPKVYQQTQFTAYADYDLDSVVFGWPGCHGKDYLSPDDGPLPFATFTALDSGYVQVTTPLGIENALEESTFYLTPENEVLQANRKSIDAITEKPKHVRMEPGARYAGVVAADPEAVEQYSSAEIYACYQESTDLNPELTAAQKAIVDRFFTAIAAIPEASE